jgi:hypothetical protein
MVEIKDQDTVDEYSDEAIDEWYSDEPDDGNLDPPAAEAEGEPVASSTTEEPKAEVPGDEVQKEDAAQAPEASGDLTETPQVEDPNAWIQELEPEKRAEVERIIRRDQSNSGRAAALQARLDEAQAALDAQRVAARTVRPTDTGTSSAETPKDLDDPELKEFAEEFPTVYQNMRKMMAADRDAAVQAALEEIRPLKEEQSRQHILQEKDTLRRNVEQIFNTAETGVHLEDVLQSPAWRDWLANQPPGYQEFARTSPSAQDATKVMEDFARWTEDQLALIRQQEESTQAPASGSNSQEQASEADLTAQRREESLLSANDVKARSANVNDRELADYEAYFDDAVKSG